jgi:hypothetical protein
MASSRGGLNGAKLVQRLAHGVSVPQLEIRRALLALMHAGIVDRIGPTGDPLGRVSILKFLPDESAPLLPHERAWREVVDARDIAPALKEALSERGGDFADISRNDMEHLLDGILRLIADRGLLAERDPYEISAKYLLGSSKILGKLGGILEAGGVPQSLLGKRPRYVLGAGPARSAFALLVENLECFERLVNLGLSERITVVATFGYGITWSGISVEGRLDRIKIARASGEPPSTLASVVAATTCCFWGDLDLAGLSIFVSLRRLVPHLRLSALYAPMVSALEQSATSHPYCGLVEKLGHIEPITDDDAVSRLAAACRTRAVDQEYVSDHDMSALAHLALDEATEAMKLGRA